MSYIHPNRYEKSPDERSIYKRCEDMRKERDELKAQVAEMHEALSDVNKLIAEASTTGFNYKDGDWPDRMFFSQQKTSRALGKGRAKRSPAAWLLRQKADAVDQAGSDIGELIFLSKNPGEVSGFNMSAGVCEIYANRLRKDADEADETDKAGGGDE